MLPDVLQRCMETAEGKVLELFASQLVPEMLMLLGIPGRPYLIWNQPMHHVCHTFA